MKTFEKIVNLSPEQDSRRHAGKEDIPAPSHPALPCPCGRVGFIFSACLLYSTLFVHAGTVLRGGDHGDRQGKTERKCRLGIYKGGNARNIVCCDKDHGEGICLRDLFLRFIASPKTGLLMLHTWQFLKV